MNGKKVVTNFRRFGMLILKRSMPFLIKHKVIAPIINGYHRLLPITINL